MQSRAAAAQIDYATNFDLEPGGRVCFTGTGEGLTRTEWHQLARAAGLRPTSNLTPEVALLVVSVHGAAGSKAGRAIVMGVPVTTYAHFRAAVEAVVAPP